MNSTKADNMAVMDDTAAILNLSEDAFGDGVVTVKSTAATRAVSYTEIVNAQNCLRTLGFYEGSNTGYVSADMEKSIMNFQKVYGLEEDGDLTSATYNKIVEVNNFYNTTMNDSDMASLKNTLFGSSSISSSLKTTLTKNLALTWTFLIKGMGLTEKQAAGAMGNIMQESYFCPTNANDETYPGIDNPNYDFATDTEPYSAYGLIQWKFSTRRSDLATVAGNMELDVGDINAQFACIRYESETFYSNAWSNLRLSNTVESATQIFKEQYEQCYDDTFTDRKNYANTIYTALKTE